MNKNFGKMICNDTKMSGYDFLKKYLLSVEIPVKIIGICPALNPEDFTDLPGKPKIKQIREIYTDKIFWLLKE